MEQILLALADGQAPPEDDVDIVNRSLKAAMADRCLVRTADGYAWGWDDGDDLGRDCMSVKRGRKVLGGTA